MKIDRLIAILLYLLSRDKVTARELSSYFAVTLRTIYRDMETLSLAGVPIASMQGMEGGYGLVDSFKLDRAFFKEEELLSLFTALKGINAAIKDDAIETVLLKLKALSSKSSSVRAKQEALPSILYIPIPWGAHDWSGLLETVRKGIRQRRVLVFTYTKTDGRAAKRRVEPLTLVLQAAVWYLYAWDLGKKDYRFFRLSRFTELSIEERSIFVRKPGKKPYPWEEGWEAEPPIDLTLIFSPEAAQKARDAFPWHCPEQRPDGSLVFAMRFPYGDWAESQILSFGPQAEVLEPGWVRERIGELAGKIAGKYGR